MKVRALTESEETRDHQFRAVAHSVDGAVLDHNSLVGGQEALKRLDDRAQVGLVALVVVHPLGIHDIVQRDQAHVLIHGSTPHTSQLLHVRAHAEQETQVNAKGSDIGSCLATDPKHAQVSVIVELVELALVDGPDTELALDGRDQGRPLEERTGQGLKSAAELRLAAGNLVVKTNDANVLLTRALLRLHEASCTVDTDDQTAGNFGIEGSTVASLLDSVGKLKRVQLATNGLHLQSNEKQRRPADDSTSEFSSSTRQPHDWTDLTACRD